MSSHDDDETHDLESFKTGSIIPDGNGTLLPNGYSQMGYGTYSHTLDGQSYDTPTTLVGFSSEGGDGSAS
jgi:hypothetical protein